MKKTKQKSNGGLCKSQQNLNYPARTSMMHARMRAHGCLIVRHPCNRLEESGKSADFELPDADIHGM